MRDIDASFVGQRTTARAKVIDGLRRAGINVYVRGWGWPEGRVSYEEMLAIFLRSKICLNINDASSRFRTESLARLFFARSRNRIVADFRIWDNFRTWLRLGTPQIKARPFELAACGAFVISGYADDLGRYYKEDKEMIFYRDIEELARKIKHHLPLMEERERIAKAGYERTLREHTYEKRFLDIFKQTGLIG